MKKTVQKKRILWINNDDVRHEFADPAKLQIDELVQHVETRKTGYVVSPSIHQEDSYWVMFHGDAAATLCHSSYLETEIGAPFARRAV